MQTSKDVKFTFNAKITISFLFLIFLMLFPKYSPFIESVDRNSITGQIFNLYFFIANQTLGIVHESGHGVCYILPCPEFLMILNGTLFQIGFPFGIYLYYRHKNNPFASYIALFFTGFSLYYTSWYISTSDIGPILPASKSFLGVDAYHDFYYILNRLGVLKYYKGISSIVKLISIGIMFFSVAKMFITTLSSKER